MVEALLLMLELLFVCLLIHYVARGSQAEGRKDLGLFNYLESRDDAAPPRRRGR